MDVKATPTHHPSWTPDKTRDIRWLSGSGATPEASTRCIGHRLNTHKTIKVAGRRTSSVFLLMQIMNYKSARWKKLREKILRRDGYMCQSSLRYGRHIEADTVHHIFPASKFPEYEWEPWNLISLCAAEHNAMHVRDSDDLTDKGIKLQEKVARQNGITQ